MDLSAIVTRWSPHKNACVEAFIEEANQGPTSPALRAEFVKFVDGAYTKWHYHTGEQMLLSAAGEGFVEYQDRPEVTIREGTRVFIPPGVWHRHGAVPKSTLVHLAVTYGTTCWADDDPCQRPSHPERCGQLPRRRRGSPASPPPKRHVLPPSCGSAAP